VTRGYLALGKCSVLANLAYRAHFFFTLASTVLGIILQYFLWKAIYAGQESIKGMSFGQAFTWVALSSTFFTMFITYVDWDMCYSVMDGTIAQSLIKPTDYQLYMLAQRLGNLALNVIIIALPSLALLGLVFRASIPVGPNLAFFSVSIVLSFVMSYVLEFIVGVISFMTASVWGISAAKNVIVSVLSGAVVPLAFFPPGLKAIAEALPFRAMYDVPLRILLTPGFDPAMYLRGLGLQLFWILAVGAFSRIFFNRVIRVITISGG
jgi:ABC-2 type transport system permease protein